MNNSFDILIVGCGLSGIVIAERFANILNKKVLIIDKRDHIGGNIYDYIDEETNILVGKYGAHLFHTNNERVWEYINKFDKWIRWDHQVLGYVDDKLINIPVNINTVNSLCNENIKSKEEMNIWLEKNQLKYNNIDDSEKMGKSRVGEYLYEKIFKDYTYKQWNKYPNELDPSVLARIPIRNDHDNRYFNDKYQVLPANGYSHFVNKILDNKNIETEAARLFNNANKSKAKKAIIDMGRDVDQERIEIMLWHLWADLTTKQRETWMAKARKKLTKS
jgi:UDP-galactopyranose mutase